MVRKTVKVFIRANKRLCRFDQQNLIKPTTSLKHGCAMGHLALRELLMKLSKTLQKCLTQGVLAASLWATTAAVSIAAQNDNLNTTVTPPETWPRMMIVYDNQLVDTASGVASSRNAASSNTQPSNTLLEAQARVADLLQAESTDDATVMRRATSTNVSNTDLKRTDTKTTVRDVNSWLQVADISDAQAKNMAELSQNLKDIPGVVGVIPDYKTQAFLTANDQFTNLQWHYYDPVGGINLSEAWDTALDGSFENTLPTVNVAVIDSGILSHEDLNDNVLPGADFISVLEIARDGDGRDTDPSDPGDYMPAGFCAPNIPAAAIPSSWHGTVISGLIAAGVNNGIGVAGVAPNAKIIPIRVLGPCGGSLLDALEGMLWAAGGTVVGLPDNPNPAAVVNLSFGVEGALCTPEIQSFVDGVANLGAVLVAATGNSAIDTQNVVPASCNNVIAIGAASSTGNAANYSNLGAAVDLLAPGASPNNPADPDLGLLSTSNSGAEGPVADDYIRGYAGTSMAAPHVSGVIAMMLGLDPALSASEIEQILKDTARPFPAACNGCGAGRLDAQAAVEEVKGGTVSAILSALLVSLLFAKRFTRNHSIRLARRHAETI